MATFYQEMATTVEELLSEFGGNLTVRSQSYTPVVSPETEPWDVGDADDPVDVTVKGVLLDYENKEIDGTLVLAGDRRVLLAPTDNSGNSTNPQIGDTIIHGSDSYRVMRPNPIQPTDTLLLWDIQVRR